MMQRLRSTFFSTRLKAAPAAWSLKPQDVNTRPQQFLQRVVQSDGSTFTIRTSSPRPMQTLTKDTRNHVLWNPEKASGLEEGSPELARFALKYGSTSMATTSGLGFVFDEPVVVEKKKKVVEVVLETKKGKTKK